MPDKEKENTQNLMVSKRLLSELRKLTFMHAKVILTFRGMKELMFAGATLYA